MINPISQEEIEFARASYTRLADGYGARLKDFFKSRYGVDPWVRSSWGVAELPKTIAEAYHLKLKSEQFEFVLGFSSGYVAALEQLMAIYVKEAAS